MKPVLSKKQCLMPAMPGAWRSLSLLHLPNPHGDLSPKVQYENNNGVSPAGQLACSRLWAVSEVPWFYSKRQRIPFVDRELGWKVSGMGPLGSPVLLQQPPASLGPTSSSLQLLYHIGPNLGCQEESPNSAKLGFEIAELWARLPRWSKSCSSTWGWTQGVQKARLSPCTPHPQFDKLKGADGGGARWDLQALRKGISHNRTPLPGS